VIQPGHTASAHGDPSYAGLVRSAIRWTAAGAPDVQAPSREAS